MRFLLLGSIFLLAHCGTQEPEKPIITETPTATTKAPAPKQTVDSGDGRDQGNQQTISMSLSLAGVTLDIAAQGTLHPNSVYHLEMVLVAGSPGGTVRVWIGDESGKGSMKTKADGHGDHYHAHVLTPKVINEKTALWIEVQSVTGDRATGRIALQ